MNGKCDLLKLSFVWDFQQKKRKKRNGVQFCLTSFGTEKWSCVIKAVEMFIFFPPINVSNSD